MATPSDIPSVNYHTCLVLKNVSIIDDKPLGEGAYGRVFEVQYAGRSFAAKEIHSLFFRIARPKELIRLKSNFIRECNIWSTLRHPNIVNLIGVYFVDSDTTGLPIMVMEKMECTLTSLIENGAVGDIDLQKKISILHDVSGGLWHLHNLTPPIVHRDLTPSNVLLRQGEAKISDLGVSKAMKTDTTTSTSSYILSKVPGTPDFMPPETFEDKPRYGTAVDIFSYAGIVLFTITEEWPTPTARETYNSENQKREIVSEVDRRQKFLNKMAEYHGEKLRPLVMSCLNDKPESRPSIEKVSVEIEAFKKSPDNYKGFDFVPPTALHKPSDGPVLQVS